MPLNERGSLTKEPPLETLDATLQLVTPGMSYDQLRTLATERTHPDAPGLLRSRFLLLTIDERIQYDRLLSLIKAYGVSSPIVRKVMYFTWAWRDERIRSFVAHVIADKAGRWRVSRLTDKSQATAFEQWLSPPSAKKARSNFEFFLREAGIYNPVNKTVELSLVDGWLAEAMLTAAQHEKDRELKSVMVRDPLGSLFRLGLNGLANVAVGDKANLGAQTVADFVQSEEDVELGSPEDAPGLGDWRDRISKPITRKRPETVVDLVALERATGAHLRLERVLARILRDEGRAPQCSRVIDMCADIDDTLLLVEIKSCNSRNVHSQIRRGLSQLLEYEFVYGGQLRLNVLKLLVIETAPPPNKRWLIEYLASLGITVAWKDNHHDRLITTAPLPHTLKGIVETAA